MGVFRIPDGQIKLKERVADPAIVGDVTQLVIVHDAGQIAVWTININRQMCYTRGVRTDDPKVIKWSKPFVFLKDCARVAPTRSPLLQTNELFCLDQDIVLRHYWQDPVSTSWQKRIGSLQGKPTVVNYESYTSHIHFEQSDIPVWPELSVTSSEWVYATINGVVHSIHDSRPALVKPDAMGNLTIICDAVDTAPPVFHISGSSFAQTLNVYPNGKLHKNLAGITDGNSISMARDQAGNPVAKGDTDSGLNDGVASRVRAVHDVGDTEFPPVKLGGNTFTVVEHPSHVSERGLKHTLMAPIRLFESKAGLAADSELVLAMTFADGKWRPMTPAELQAHSLAAHSVTSLGGFFDWIGDAWHALESAADSFVSSIKDAVVWVGDAVHFVLNKVNDVLQLVVHFAEEVVAFALDTFINVFKAISSLLKLIGIDISALLRWLGHLIGWDTIWDTHKLIASTMQNFLHFGVSNADGYLDKARLETKHAFANLDQRLKDLEPSHSKTLSQARPTLRAGPKLSNSPQANFAFYHFSNSLPNAEESELSRTLELQSGTSDAVGQGDFGNMFEQIIMPFVNDIIPKLGEDAGRLIDVLKSGSVTDIITLFVDLLTTLLDTVEDALDLLLATVQQVLGQLESVLDGDFGLPILGAIYRFVTLLMGDEESFSVINGFSFIAAVAVVAAIEITGETQLPHRNLDFANPDFPGRLERMIRGKTGLEGHADMQLVDAPGPQSDITSSEWSYVAGTILNITNLLGAFANVIPGNMPVVANAKFACSLACTIFGFPLSAGDDQIEDTYVQRVISWIISGTTGLLTALPQGVSSRVDGLFAGRSMNASRVQGGVGLLVGILVTALAIEIDVREQADPLTFSADTFGNVGGITSSVGQFLENVELNGLGLAFTFVGTNCATVDLVMATSQNRVFKRILARM